PPQDQLGPLFLQGFSSWQFLRGLGIGSHYPGSQPQQQACCGKAAPGQANDNNPLSGNFHFVTSSLVGLPLRSRDFQERNQIPIPSKAKIIPRIQNLITTWVSGQPTSSKWWWMGLIRKILPPVRRKKKT